MKPVSPVIPGKNFDETVFAKDQDEYENLPAIIAWPGVVLTRWKPTFFERIRLLFGGSIYLSAYTFGKPLQPVHLGVERPILEEGETKGQR